MKVTIRLPTWTEEQYAALEKAAKQHGYTSVDQFVQINLTKFIQELRLSSPNHYNSKSKLTIFPFCERCNPRNYILE